MPAPPITGGQITAGLGYGYWTGGAGLTLTYSVPGVGATWPAYVSQGAGEPSSPQYHTLSGTQASQFAATMELYDSLLGATFDPVSDSTPGAIRIAFSNLNSPGTWGYAYLTEPGTAPSDTGIAGDIWLNTQNVASDNPLATGTYDWQALMHEIGHALGLKHPFEGGSTLPPEYDNYRYTIMSYTSQTDAWNWTIAAQSGGGVVANATGVYALTPMLFDIYTLQSLYGADPNTRSGDTTYTFDPNQASLQTIYDAGGTDTWDLSGHTRPSYVDLTPAAFSSIDYYSQTQQVNDNVAIWGEGYRSFFNDVYDDPDVYHYQNNVAIAYNTIIENVSLGNGNDSALGNDANNLLMGNAGNDTLTGGIGDDTLNGGSGTDVLAGGAGDDLYVIDSLSDTATESAGQGTDTVQATVTWTLGSGFENLTLMGGVALTGIGNELNNIVAGNGANNVLYGKTGDDTLSANGGADTLWGGDGNDSLNGGVGADFLDGGNNNDWLHGDDDADTLYGRAGADSLDGGAGADTMYGGAGDDVYFVDNTGDLTLENSASGLDSVQTTVTYSLAAYIENLVLSGSSAINGTGNILGNSIYGNEANNTLSGVAGADALYGNGGADTLNGGTGNDTLSGGDGNDVLDGGSEADSISGGNDNDTLFGRIANDTLDGGAGADTIYGGDGDDYITGGTEADLIDGGNHNDTVFGGDGDDTVYGRQNIDYLNGEAGNDTLYGGDGGDTINGGDNNDFLDGGNDGDNVLGGAGSDTMYGRAGNDVLDGGAGADTMTGGDGDDSFSFTAGQAAGDVITDFHGNGSALGDSFGFHGYGTAAAGATFVQLDATHWQINSADGTIHETITLTNGASVDPTDYFFS